MLMKSPCIGGPIYRNRLTRSVSIEPYFCDQFQWPNIYDLVEYLVSERIEENRLNGYSDLAHDETADEVANEIAIIQETISMDFITKMEFSRDPSGLLTSLKILKNERCPTYGTERGLDTIPFAKIDSCIRQFNLYFQRLIFKNHNKVIISDQERVNNFQTEPTHSNNSDPYAASDVRKYIAARPKRPH
ncbi:hypothetical protein Q9299_19885 [Gemmobacter fulvus]|uniref:hypothetical protein n=1 Tax=Gemmobacter fulvus TaxID=2840474 RepID=UPI002796ACBA|nr:hypothetical protein [Gemmobacter fulvus]MDQ1850570.1 hypothetical protein [Gemmobacter fulvus]